MSDDVGTDLILWKDAWVQRHAELREARSRRRWIALIVVAPCFAFGSTLLALANRPPEIAEAQESAPVTAAPTTTTSTPLEPESVPTTTAPGWLTVRVLTPGFDGLGKVVTDGQRAPRVLPGDLGRAVVAVDADPSSAATVIVDGREWRVFNRGAVGSNELGKLVDGRTVVPVVVVVSSLPGDRRPYVEAQ